MLAACGNKGGTTTTNDGADSLGVDTTRLSAAAVAPAEKAFDIHDYLEMMEAMACPRFMRDTADVKFMQYALIDIDGDGQHEVMVNDDNQKYVAVFAIVGDSIEMLADADVCCDLEFYKGAVGFSGYYTPGRSAAGASIVKNSRCAEDYYMETKFDIFNDEMELEYESYYVNNEPSDEESCNKFQERLGETVTVEPEWQTINR